MTPEPRPEGGPCARPHVVAIHGAPRSGTSWLGQLFNSSPVVAYRYQPLFSHAFRGRVDAGSDRETIERFFSDLLASDDPFLHQTGKGRLTAEAGPRFDKDVTTHLIYKEVRFHQVLPRILEKLPDAKAVGIVRDPRRVLASWARAPREFDPTWSFDREWRRATSKNQGKDENWYGYERWKALATMFLELDATSSRFMLVRYEDLLWEPEHFLRDLFRFTGIPFVEQSRQFIRDSMSRYDGDPYGVFRIAAGPAGSVPDDIGNCIVEDLQGSPLARFLAG